MLLTMSRARLSTTASALPRPPRSSAERARAAWRRQHPEQQQNNVLGIEFETQLPLILYLFADAELADGMRRTLLLAAWASAGAASWTAGVARVARSCPTGAAPACSTALHASPQRFARRRLDGVAPVEMCAAVGSISPSQSGFQSGFGIRNKARLLRRSWVIWTCCIWQGWKVLLLRRKYMSNPKSPEAAEARRKLAADLRDTLIRLGPTFIKARARSAAREWPRGVRLAVSNAPLADAALGEH